MSDKDPGKPRRQNSEPERNENHRFDPFDIAGSDPETLHSGRIPDPEPAHTPLFRALARGLTAIEERLRARGGKPLRVAIRVFWGLAAAAGAFLLVGPVINAPLSIDDILDSADLDEVEWIARDAEIDYVVTRSDDGTFDAEVSERFNADFRNGPVPAVERTVVTEFQGHDTGFTLIEASVDGVKVDPAIDRKSTTTTMRITPPDGGDFDGTQEIAVRYTVHDLITSETDEATGRTIDQWDWPVFAPTWPQATKGIEVSFTFPQEVADQLVRQPRAYIGWLLISAAERLDPESGPGGTVKFSFTNDDSLPPNADVWITATFEPGTFAQPPKTSLFWVQTYGPLVPMAILILMLLFSLSARRIVWADTRGEPWYVARSEPVHGVDPSLAAELMRKPRHAELVRALTVSQGSAGGRTEWLAQLARAGRRSGRLGNLLAAWRFTGRWFMGSLALARGLRWKPDSYVRDTLILGPLAVTLVQWGLLRQLSHHMILSVVWWPATFVLVSTAIALISVLAVRRPCPLTRAGAITLQQLKGIDAYAKATRLIERGPATDPLLPYAVLFESPREAGDAVTDLAITETGDRDLTRGWRTDRFLTGASLAALGAAAAILIGAIVAVSIVPPPYENSKEYLTEYTSLPGTVWTQGTGVEIEASISRGAGGAPRVDVVEHHTVEFDARGGSVPQFSREWNDRRLGQDLGFELESVRLDGAPIEHRELRSTRTRSIAMVTQIEDALSGMHDIEVRYVLTRPVVDAKSDGDAVQQLRWVALLDFWDDRYFPADDEAGKDAVPVRPIRFEVTIAPEVASKIVRGGWIASDWDRHREPDERGNWFNPWTYEFDYASDVTDGLHTLRIGSSTTLPDGSLRTVLDFDEMGAPEGDLVDKYQAGLTSDIGVMLDFAPGTFPTVETGAYAAYRTILGLPYAVLLALAAIVIAAALGLIAWSRRAPHRANSSVSALSYVVLPVLGLAQTVLFFWAIGPMSGDDSRIAAAVVLGLGMWAAVLAQVFFVIRKIGRNAPGLSLK